MLVEGGRRIFSLLFYFYFFFLHFEISFKFPFDQIIKVADNIINKNERYKFMWMGFFFVGGCIIFWNMNNGKFLEVQAGGRDIFQLVYFY